MKRHVVPTHLPATGEANPCLQPGFPLGGCLAMGRMEERRRAAWQGGSGEGCLPPLPGTCFSCFLLLYPLDGTWFLLLYPTVEHQSGGIAPSSQPPRATLPWVPRAPPGASALPEACGPPSPC